MNVVSLFAGCGGFDLGFKTAGFDVIWANDIDKYAVQTYQSNFDNKIVHADICSIPTQMIPHFDLLLAGFPCQPFSVMGSEKGFDDTRGTLFFKIVEIVKYQIDNGQKPKVIVLENVRSLRSHNHGKTFTRILEIMQKDLNYKVFHSVLNSADYGVPQKRNRAYIICFADHNANFDFPFPTPLVKLMPDCLESNVPDKYYLSEKIQKTILSSGSGKFYAKPEIDLNIARPLTATMGKMHRACQDNYVTQKGKIRRLTPRECARLQGFPDSFVIPVSDAQAYKQFGNAVTVNVAYSIATSIKQALIALEQYGEKAV